MDEQEYQARRDALHFAIELTSTATSWLGAGDAISEQVVRAAEAFHTFLSKPTERTDS